MESESDYESALVESELESETLVPESFTTLDRRILVFCLILEVNICSLARRLTCVTTRRTDDRPCGQHL